MSNKQTDNYNEYMFENSFESNFDEWKALGYLRSYPARYLKLIFTPDFKNFAKKIDPEAVAYELESEKLLDKYIEDSEYQLMQNLPF